MFSFQKIISSMLGGSSETRSTTTAPSAPPYNPAPPSPPPSRRPVFWYEQRQRNNIRSASSQREPPPPPPVTKHEKKQPPTKGEDVSKRTTSNTPPPPTQPIAITIPTLTDGAKSFIQNYLALEPPPPPVVTKDVKRTASNILPSSQASVPLPSKRRRNDQLNMETPSLRFTQVKVNPPTGRWGISLKEAKEAKHVITIVSIHAECVMKGQLKVGDQLTGVDGNITFSSVKEVQDLKQLHTIRTLTFKRLVHARPSDVIEITSSSDDDEKSDANNVIVIASSTDEDPTDIQ